MLHKDLVEQIEETVILHSLGFKATLVAGLFTGLVRTLIERSNFDEALYTILMTATWLSIGAVVIGIALTFFVDEENLPVTHLFIIMAWRLTGYTVILTVGGATLFITLLQLPFDLLFVLQACLGIIIFGVAGIFAVALKDVLIARRYELEKIQKNSSDE